MEQEPKHGARFWAGNGVLALAALCLLFMETLAQRFGTGAVALWMALAAAGVYLIVTDGSGG